MDVPATFGRFQIVREIGQGAKAVVYEAIDPALGRRIALKVLRRDARTTFEEVERLRREAQALALVHHPHVVTVYESSTVEGTAFVAMELVAGATLTELIAAKTIEREELIQVVEQAARGVHAVHQTGTLHRDLKPANIIIDERGARVVDFGLARLEKPDAALTDTGSFLGSPAYMAPEQALAKIDRIGPWTDVYSLGATLFEVLTGEAPYPAIESTYQFLKLVSAPEPVRRARSVDDTIDPELDAIVARCLAKEPAERFASAGELADELQAFLERTRNAEPGRRPSGIAIAAIALALLVAAFAIGIAGAALSRKEPAPVPTPSPTPSPAAVVAIRTPPWYEKLAASERPPLPLPDGLIFGGSKGEYINTSDESVLVFVPGGSFTMGSAKRAQNMRAKTNDDERPVHPVELSAYFVGKYELTNARFERFVKDTHYVTDIERAGKTTIVAKGRGTSATKATWKHPAGSDEPFEPDHPVVQVTWRDAHAYCKWANLRLPTEAEWERAAVWDAALGRERTYPWGEDAPNAERANLAGLGGRFGLAPVGSFPSGASPVGAEDMLGNVWEICEDAYDEKGYARHSLRDPIITSPASAVVVRGLSWSNPTQVARIGHRGVADPDGANDAVGFRVARSAR